MIRLSSLFFYPFLGAFLIYMFGYAAIGRNALPLQELLALVAMIFALPGLALRLNLMVRRAHLFFGFYALYLLTLAFSTALAGNPGTSKLLAFAVDAFVDTKAYALALALLIFVPVDRLERLFIVMLKVLFGITLLNAIFVLRDLTASTSIHGFTLERRFGLSVPVGLFDHKLKSAQFQLLGMIGGMALLIRGTRRRLAVKAGVVFLTLSVIAHMSVKELTAVAVVRFFYIVIRRGTGFGTRTVLAGLFLLLVTILTTVETPIRSAVLDRIDVFLGEGGDKTVRTASYLGSFMLASDHMPFGTGAATFMSKGARDLAYSTYYYTTGISELYGGSPEDPRFIMDTFWPKILGQAGFLGLFFYLGANLMACRWSLRNYSRSFEATDFAASMIVIVTLVFSLATPAYTHDHLIMPLAAAFALILSDKNRRGMNTHGS